MYEWPVFLINLKRDTERLTKCVTQFENLNIPFERLDAADGSTLSENEIAQAYDPVTNRRRAADPLLPSEIGCYLSHIRAWNRIVERDADGGFIFEDDFQAETGLPEVLRLLPKHFYNWDMIKLFAANPDRSWIEQHALGSKHKIVSPYKIPNVTIAYGLTKDTAQHLIERATPFFRPIDEDLKYFWETRLQIGLVLPLPVAVNPQTAFTKTSIGRGRHQFKEEQKRKLSSNIVRSLRRFIYQIRYEFSVHFHRNWRW